MSSERDNLERWRLIFRRLLDPSPAHVVLLDLEGVILETNAAWRKFARDNGMPASYTFIGTSYLDVVEFSAGEDGPTARAAYVGLQEVLRNQRAKFTMVYPCHSPRKKRWFRMWVEPQLPSVPAIVVAHYLTDPPGSTDREKHLPHASEVTPPSKTMH